MFTSVPSLVNLHSQLAAMTFVTPLEDPRWPSPAGELPFQALALVVKSPGLARATLSQWKNDEIER